MANSHLRRRRDSTVGDSRRGAENHGHKNDGPPKCPGMKLTDLRLTGMKMQDMFQVAEYIYYLVHFGISLLTCS